MTEMRRNMLKRSLINWNVSVGHSAVFVAYNSDGNMIAERTPLDDGLNNTKHH